MNLDDSETLEKIWAEAIDVANIWFSNEAEPLVCFGAFAYSGWVKSLDGNGGFGLTQYKDGKMVGPATVFYSNGQKKQETTGVGSRMIAAVAWKPNGEKCPVTNVVNGNGVVVDYNEDGTENFRCTWKDGGALPDKALLRKFGLE